MAESWWDGSGTEALSFDAWGKRRLSTGQDGNPALSSNTTPWGFTGQEHLDPLGLIQMNRRMASVGRLHAFFGLR
jgi:hypothetical protein